MRYQAFDYMQIATKPLATTFSITNRILKSNLNPLVKTRFRRLQSAVIETGARFLKHYPKQGWDYEDVKIKGRSYPVVEEILLAKPFCNLIKFRCKGLGKGAPKVLFIAALSGHHATLSRETFAEFLPDHEVYVTDWLDARYIPVDQGRFGLEEYIDYVIDFIQFLGSDIDVIGLCQAGVPTLVAAAVLSKNKKLYRPRSLTLIASPMDVRVNPGPIHKLTKYMNPVVWQFYAIHSVPDRYAGVGRMVYPGIMQLTGFMSMNITSHMEQFYQFACDIYHEDIDATEKHREFYDEYFSTLDMPAEYCLETIERVFINNELAEGRMTYKGQRVELSSIEDIPLLAMEGEKDDLVRLGQCVAAIDICKGLADAKKEKYVQSGVGHYGIFNGSTYRSEVAPKIKAFIAANR